MSVLGSCASDGHSVHDKCCTSEIAAVSKLTTGKIAIEYSIEVSVWSIRVQRENMLHDVDVEKRHSGTRSDKNSVNSPSYVTYNNEL